jgi:HEPN domain-containing protein
LEEAKERLGSAGRALGEKRYWTAVFYAQKCSEYAAKALLESLSVRYPPIHDVGDLIRGLKDDERLPRWFRDECTRASEVITNLARLRPPARYGDQAKKIPPFELFSRSDAQEAMNGVKSVYELSERFMQWWFRRGEGKQSE